MTQNTLPKTSFKIKPLFIFLVALLLGLVAYGSYLYFAPNSSFPPDTRIVESKKADYAYENTKNEFTTHFKAKPTDINSIVFTNDLGKISFFTPINQSFGIINSESPPIADGNTLTYPDIFTQLDLRYTISSSRLLEEFIIKDKDTATLINQIDQKATTNNDYIFNADGSITFSKNGQLSFTIPHPVMYEVDHPEIFSIGIKYSIKEDSGQLIITKVISPEGKAWLADGMRKYPIAIDLVIDTSDTAANWISSDTVNSVVTQEATIKQEGTGSVKVATTTTSNNNTITRTTGASNLSSEINLIFWVRSSVAGSFVRFQFGESASTEQTYAFTIAQANIWEQIVWDISAISGASRDAVTKFAFQFTGNTSGALFYFDDIQTNTIGAPTLGVATALSSSSLRWNFTDNATGETGFKIYDSGSSLLVTCASANISSCDETGLTPNTQYTRKIGAYSATATTIRSGTVSKYTLAAVPSSPIVNTRNSTTVLVNPNPGTNSSGTLMAIYRETGTTCDGSGGVYLAANGSSNGATAIWQNDATWGSVTATGLTTETQYTFCVKAKNGDNVETGFSGLGADNGGYIPISGSFINSSTTSAINKYVDGTNAARYVIGVDNNGPGGTNDAVFELQSGIFTLNSNETLVTGSMNLTGGTLAIATGSIIKLNTPVWAVDADADGYTLDNKLYYGAAPTNGRRKYLLTTLSATDCAENSYNLTNSCCTVATRYLDADGDTYGNPSVSISSCPVGGYVDNNTDCYDGNANAKPGQTTCYSTNRGDGSYDYNCVGGGVKTGCTTLNYSQSSYGTGSTVSCVGPAGARVCGSYQNHWVYDPITTTCGSAGATCAGTLGLDTDCTDNGVTCSKGSAAYTGCTSLANVGNQTCI